MASGQALGVSAFELLLATLAAPVRLAPRGAGVTGVRPARPAPPHYALYGQYITAPAGLPSGALTAPSELREHTHTRGPASRATSGHGWCADPAPLTRATRPTDHVRSALSAAPPGGCSPSTRDGSAGPLVARPHPHRRSEDVRPVWRDCTSERGEMPTGAITRVHRAHTTDVLCWAATITVSLLASTSMSDSVSVCTGLATPWRRERLATSARLRS